jgi:chorismate mutase/prephenate dehydratase
MTIQSPKISYLGPPATFSHEAAIGLFGADANLIPLTTIPSVMQSVRADEAFCGVVPIENSIHGEVTTTMDALVFDFVGLYAHSEIVVPVSFCAFARTEDDSQPKVVLSHPHAIAQCRGFVNSLAAEVRNSDSTARACEEVATSADPGMIAIASMAAGRMYGLRLMASKIEDYPGAATKFYALSKHFSVPSGNDKSLLVLIPRSQDTGTLVRLLSPFSNQRIDVVSIHSRPLRSSLGSYCFILTVAGHIGQPPLFSVLNEIVSSGTALKFLGSFPAWKGTLPAAPFETIKGASDRPADTSGCLESMRVEGTS